jgi:hypothetical protein
MAETFYEGDDVAIQFTATGKDLTGIELHFGLRLPGDGNALVLDIDSTNESSQFDRDDEASGVIVVTLTDSDTNGLLTGTLSTFLVDGEPIEGLEFEGQLWGDDGTTQKTLDRARYRVLSSLYSS